MLCDRYGNEVATSSQAALDAYVEGVDLFLAAQAGADTAFERAIAADERFALAHVGLARVLQFLARPAEAVDVMARARSLADGLSPRERGHIAIFDLLISGNGPAAYAAILDHVNEFPRDAMAVQPCCGVFGLIGFSGKAGREAEQLAFLAALAPHYGDDWWFESLFAFAQVEAGQQDRAQATIDRAFAANRANAHAAHILAHVLYEAGEDAAGRAHVESWRRDYDRGGLMHCHLSWHEALWVLEAGDTDRAWAVYDADVRPGAAWGPPINVLTDSGSFLMRAEFAGAALEVERWRDLCDYAATFFPAPGASFADAHAALACAMAGEDDALAKFCETGSGPAADMVRALAGVYAAFARGDWQDVVEGLTPVMSSHERLGGSRAQRDLLEYTLAVALLRLGRGDEASRLLRIRRPKRADCHAIAGL